MSALLKKMNLGATLWVAFGLLLALSIAQGLIVVSRIAEAERSAGAAVATIDRLSDDVNALRDSASDASVTIDELSGRVETELAASMRAGKSDMLVLERSVEGAVDAACAIVEELETLLDSGDLPDEAAGVIEDLLFDAEDSADKIRKESLPMVRTSVERLAETAETSVRIAEGIAAYRGVMNGFASSSDSVNTQAADAAGDIRSSAVLASGARLATLVAAGVALLLGIGVPLAVVPRINAEVRRTIHAMEAVAKGNLAERIKPGAFSEFARIGSAVNTAVEAMASTVGSIRAGASRLATSSDELTSTADTLGGSVDTTKQLTCGVAAASEEMSSSMGEIAASVAQVSSSNTDISEAANQMLSTIQDVSASVERAAGVAADASELIGSGEQEIARLGDAAGEIGEVSNVIQDIAEMTNLLALNATIEAARAGEAGKGFAVVATEVKELARQTSDATETIRQRIESIQHASNQAVNLVSDIDGVIRKVRDESDRISEHVRGQGDTTQQIASKISEVATAAEVVACNVSQTAEASREIAESIAKVDSAAVTTSTAASATRSSGAELTMLAHEFSDTLAFFKSV